MERRKKHGGRRNKKTKSIQNDPNSTLLQVEVEDNLTDLNQNTLNPNSNNDLNTECETFSDSESIPGVEMIPEIGSNFSDSSGSKVSSRRRLKQEAWEFIRGECFLRDGIRPETVAVWLRTLLDQNSRLVETLNRTRREQEKPKYIRPDPGSIEHMGRNKDLERDEFTEKTEHNSKLLDTLSIIRSCESSFEVDDGMEKYENETEKYENGTEKYENGTEKTCEERLQVFGSLKGSPTQGPPPNRDIKIQPKDETNHIEPPPSSLYDSRSSLNSEIEELESKRITRISRKEYSEVKSLRRELVRLQTKCSDSVREGVERDTVIAELQVELTELSTELEDLRVENNANLSVIDKLKDDLYEARRTQISSSRSNLNIAKHCSVTSLPDIPVYKSRFANHISRRNSQNAVIQKLGDQLSFTNRAKGLLEEERKELLDKLEELESEYSLVKDNLEFVKREFEDLGLEHEKLKGDFRTLIRIQNFKEDDSSSIHSSKISLDNDTTTELRHQEKQEEEEEEEQEEKEDENEEEEQVMERKSRRKTSHKN
ncbi:FK506-binding protein 5 isoform X2 [Eurytemora carolleeae]|uniref:FK506-binding protein 5 isoform X2 n=1 Tax=Eurytemora carolleeae TaxID=1294199 RepID=UPI000C7892E6|nr:FK506-binding protein 5 isoform X2 [Eurytemora carolleeae]|eukprot:XP_023340389.1 FK506-binding protein 5-like isoform X2 [Eurytemora affinis]